MRNDIHSPKNFDPAEYEYVGSFDLHPGPGCYIGKEGDFDTPFGHAHGLNYTHAVFVAATNLLKTKGANIHGGELGQCDHCGVNIRYVVIFKHSSGEYIQTGETCADERFGCDSRRSYDIKRLKEAAANERERAKAFGAAQKFIDTEAPDLADLLSPKAKEVHEIFADIAGKLIRYGSISPKQVALCRKLLREYNERQANNGQTLAQITREQERAAAADCPTGRVTITGIILKTKWHDGFYGSTLKMTVKDDSGFLVWGSAPTRVNLEAGDRIQFKASVEPSDDDPKFGYFKRPTNAVVTPAKPAPLTDAEIADQVTGELHDEFPAITPENFEQADKFREERMQALKNGQPPILRDQWGQKINF